MNAALGGGDVRRFGVRYLAVGVLLQLRRGREQARPPDEKGREDEGERAGRAALDALKNGEWSPADQARPEVTLDLERPNIFRLYEQNIGPLTPLMADALREAERGLP